MLDFNNIELIDDNNLNSVKREFLINSLLTHDNLPKIFKLLYNVDIEISENPIYFSKDYNYDKPIYKILNTDVALLNEIVNSHFTIKSMDIYLSTTFINNYFKIVRTEFNNYMLCNTYIAYNKKDFDYMTLKSVLQKL
jgi:hypothetical protein